MIQELPLAADCESDSASDEEILFREERSGEVREVREDEASGANPSQAGSLEKLGIKWTWKWMEYHWATCMYVYVYIYIYICVYIYIYYKLFCLEYDWYNGNMLWNIDPTSTVWVCLKVADACYSQKTKSCLF